MKWLVVVCLKWLNSVCLWLVVCGGVFLIVNCVVVFMYDSECSKLVMLCSGCDFVCCCLSGCVGLFLKLISSVLFCMLSIWFR